MTVETTESDISYTGDGIEIDYDFNYRCDEDEWIVVFINLVAVSPTTYTVLLNADQAASPGGSVTFDAAPNSGAYITISRDIPLTQDTNYTPYDNFPAERNEADLDKLTMINQQIDKNIDNVVTRVPIYPLSVGVIPQQNIDAPVPYGYWRDKADGSGIEKVLFDTAADAARLGFSNTFTAPNDFTAGISQAGIRTTPIVGSGKYTDGDDPVGNIRGILSVSDGGQLLTSDYRKITVTMENDFSGENVSAGSSIVGAGPLFIPLLSSGSEQPTAFNNIINFLVTIPNGSGGFTLPAFNALSYEITVIDNGL